MILSEMNWREEVRKKKNGHTSGYAKPIKNKKCTG